MAALFSDYLEMETVEYTTYILHITPTCFSHLNIVIIRLYTELQKGNYLHRSYGRDHGLTKEVTYICTGIQTYFYLYRHSNIYFCVC